MGLKITELGVVVSGKVTRKFDGVNTTLVLNEEQLTELASSSALALKIFETKAD